MVDDREANVRQLAESIESGNTGDISDVLHEILADESELPKISAKQRN